MGPEASLSPLPPPCIRGGGGSGRGDDCAISTTTLFVIGWAVVVAVTDYGVVAPFQGPARAAA
jgi:hypothetical protein